ncbi:hypothetical protein HAX54_004381, partial [Datura stramonium]|nr:hypothetical protein [Datura stramonium]
VPGSLAHASGALPQTYSLCPMPPPMPHPPMPHPNLEKRTEMYNAEMHRLLDENKRLVEERIISQHELGVAREEIHRPTLLSVAEYQNKAKVDLMDQMETNKKDGTSVEEEKHVLSVGVHLVVEYDIFHYVYLYWQTYDIFHLLPDKVQIVALYATMPKDPLEITKKFMNKPVRIFHIFNELTLEGIKQFYVNVVKEERKLGALFHLYERLLITHSAVIL